MIEIIRAKSKNKGKLYKIKGQLEVDEIEFIKEEFFKDRKKINYNVVAKPKENIYGDEEDILKKEISLLLNKKIEIKIYDVFYFEKNIDDFLNKLKEEKKYDEINLIVNNVEIKNQIKENKEIKLNDWQMEEIKKYYNKRKIKKRRKELGLKEINKYEIKIIKEIWEKYTRHKIFNANINYEENGEKYKIISLFKTFIEGSTKKINKPFIIDAFKENGGIIKIDPKYNVCVYVDYNEKEYLGVLENINKIISKGDLLLNFIYGKKYKIPFGSYFVINKDVEFVGGMGIIKEKKNKENNLLIAIIENKKPNELNRVYLEKKLICLINETKDYLSKIKIKDSGSEISAIEKIILESMGLELEIPKENILFVAATNEENIENIKKIVEKYELNLKIIGKFKENKEIIIKENGKTIGYLDLEFLKNFPVDEIDGEWYEKEKNIEKDILKGIKKIKNKKEDYYDNEYLLIKPEKKLNIEGIVIKPIYDKEIGIVITQEHVYLDNKDGYNSAIQLFDYVIRKNISLGGNPGFMVALVNISIPKTKDKKTMGNIVRVCKGLYDITNNYNIPIISIEDKINNKNSLLITIISKTDIYNIKTNNFKKTDDLVYLLGENKLNLWYDEDYCEGKINFNKNIKNYNLIKENLDIIKSISAIGPGGLINEIIKNSKFIKKGVDIDISKINKEEFDILFSENDGRFLITIDKKNKEMFEKIFDEAMYLGRIRGDKRVLIRKKGKIIFNYDLDEIKNIRDGYV